MFTCESRYSAAFVSDSIEVAFIAPCSDFEFAQTSLVGTKDFFLGGDGPYFVAFSLNLDD